MREGQADPADRATERFHGLVPLASDLFLSAAHGLVALAVRAMFLTSAPSLGSRHGFAARGRVRPEVRRRMKVEGRGTPKRSILSFVWSLPASSQPRARALGR